ncbi:MAG: cell division protein SepF [Acidimicrobiia bacterium]|nr:cell division protein SepF [Acidimicrobiia bacterium]
MVYLGLVDEEPGELPPQAPAPAAARGPEPVPTPSEEERRAPRPAPRPEPVVQDGVRVMTGGVEPASGRRVEPPTRRGADVPRRATADTGQRTVRPMGAADRQPEVIAPHSFDDAKALADHIRDRTPVVLNLRDVDPDLVRRLIDFATGLTYALDGSMRKIGTGVVLVLPPRLSLGREEKRLLAEMGLYELEIEAR